MKQTKVVPMMGVLVLLRVLMTAVVVEAAEVILVMEAAKMVRVDWGWKAKRQRRLYSIYGAKEGRTDQWD